MKKIVFGVLVVMLGVFLLFRNMGFIPWGISHWVLSWQSLLVAIGAILMFDGKRETRNAGLILMLVGGIFLLSKTLGCFPARILVPSLIIIAGVVLVFRASGQRRPRNGFSGRTNWGAFRESENGANDGRPIVKREYVFSGSKEKWSDGQLKEVEIDAVFSNVELDFSRTELAEEAKGRAHIHVSSVFSNVVLYVPKEWNISIQKTGVFGGFVDKRSRNVETDETKKVVLELDAVFGGGEVRYWG
jgi:predicted membrane protein